jgi:hypothetical protein
MIPTITTYIITIIIVIIVIIAINITICIIINTSTYYDLSVASYALLTLL